MWSITFSISFAALARNHMVNRSGRTKIRAQNAKCSLLWEGGGGGDTPPPPPPLPDPPPARLLCSLAVLIANKGFRRHGNIGHFQKRSLANYWDECIWNVMVKARCYRLAPLLFGGNHILVIFFFGLKMQNSPCPGRGTPGGRNFFSHRSCGHPVRTHLHTANQSYMIWIWMTCVFGIRVRMRVDLLFYCRGEDTRKVHTWTFFINLRAKQWRPPTVILYCALIQN